MNWRQRFFWEHGDGFWAAEPAFLILQEGRRLIMGKMTIQQMLIAVFGRHADQRADIPGDAFFSLPLGLLVAFGRMSRRTG